MAVVVSLSLSMSLLFLVLYFFNGYCVDCSRCCFLLFTYLSNVHSTEDLDVFAYRSSLNLSHTGGHR